MVLFPPTFVDCLRDAVEIEIVDAADEEHFDVVFDRYKLRVVDPRLLGECFPLRVDFERYWRETRLGLISQKLGFLAQCINDAVFTGPNAAFA
jgi:hypothetical protein